MPDYKTMYFTLFNAITDAAKILNDAQIKTEEMYINSYEEEEERIKNIKHIKVIKNED